MADPVNYVLSPFKGNINTVDPQGIKLYFQPTKEKYKEAYKLDISVSNFKYILNYFFSLANKYCWGRFAFMVDTSSGAKNVFGQV